MTFVMAGGGTGGHVIPAIAVARELERRGHQAIFYGTRTGMESKLVPAAGLPIEWIEIGALNRVGLSRMLRTLWQLPITIWRVWRSMMAKSPDAVFSMGGYVAGPVVLAALINRLPVVAMEPNAVPGLTNRKIGRFLSRALVSFDETLAYFPMGRAEVTGIPVRNEFFAIGTKPAHPPFTVLVTGGSQGSRTLNEAGRASWKLFAEARLPVRIIHQAGKQGASLTQEFRASGVDGELVEFIADMPQAFAEADLVISRSGASTVSELAASGRPSILVPFPFAADNHQLRNAEAMARAGASRLILDAEMSGQRLFHEVAALMTEPSTLLAMSTAARQLARPHAAQRAADVLEEVAKRQ